LGEKDPDERGRAQPKSLILKPFLVKGKREKELSGAPEGGPISSLGRKKGPEGRKENQGGGECKS